MKDDYKIHGQVAKLVVEVEAEVAEQIHSMEKYAKISASELVNTALKRFISSHKDYLPPNRDR